MAIAEQPANTLSEYFETTKQGSVILLDLMSGLMTDEFGWKTAKGFEDRHEYRDDQHPSEAAMDLYNNRQGRMWAQQVENIGERCLEGALHGELKGFAPYNW